MSDPAPSVGLRPPSPPTPPGPRVYPWSTARSTRNSTHPATMHSAFSLVLGDGDVLGDVRTILRWEVWGGGSRGKRTDVGVCVMMSSPLVSSYAVGTRNQCLRS
jgi:hypothetical protein